MPAYRITPTNPRIKSIPINVIPCWRRRIEPPWASTRASRVPAPDEPLLNRIADPIPERSVTSIKIKPNPHRLTDQILLGDEARSLRIVLPAAVLAVIAVVAHEEIVTRRDHPLPAGDAAPGEHDLMALGPQLLVGGRHPHIIPLVFLRSAVVRSRGLFHEHIIDVELILIVHPDPVPGEADQPFDVVDLG